MATTFTNSQRADLAMEGIEPRVLIDLGSQGGTEHLSTTPLTWSGIDYAGRVTDLGDINCQIGAPDQGLLAQKTFSFAVANDDAYFSRRRPGYYAGHPITVREILATVESDALRTFTFLVARVTMPTLQTVRFDCEETWAFNRRQLVPPNTCVIDETLYPGVTRSRGGVIPVLFGRSLVPLQLVDESSNALGGFAYVACVGSATEPARPAIYELNAGRLSPFQSSSFTQCWTLQPTIRNNVPVTEIWCAPFKSAYEPAGIDLVPRWADLIAPGSLAVGDPDAVFLALTTDPIVGGGVAPSAIDSGALAAARTIYRASSFTMDGALLEQRPLEDWLGDWSHDALTALVLRDTIRLSPQTSRSAVSSVAVGSIVRGSYTYQDALLGQQHAVRTLLYRDQTRDVPGSYSQLTFTAGSGAVIARVTPFLGRQSVVAQVAQGWGLRALGGIREHAWQETIRAADREEGDLVTFSHSWNTGTPVVVDIQEVARHDGVLSFRARESGVAVWPTDALPPDRVYPTYLNGAFVPYGGLAVAPATITTSHPLGITPNRMVLQRTLTMTLVGSLVWGPTTNDSQAVVNVIATTPAGAPILNPSSGGALIGFFLSYDPAG